VKEIGRPIKHATPEIDKCVSLCNYYIKNAEKFLQPEIIETGAHKSYISYEPLGTILGIMPWNYPFWQVFRSLIPALIAGNSYVLKHASNVPGCAEAIEKIIKEAGLEKYCAVLYIDSKTASELITSKNINAISMTGSTKAGKEIATIAGKHLKRVVLELGGSDAFIVLKDANIDEAVKQGVESRFLNSGQACNSAKRFIVVESVVEEFTRKFLEKIKTLKTGDPTNPETDLGPLTTHAGFEEAQAHIEDAKEKGGKILHGGKIRDQGYYLEPTLITNVTKDMRIVKEETFSPIAQIITVPDTEAAIKESNQSQYGLGTSIWTKDLEKAQLLIPRIQSGSVYINKKVRSDPRMPFGGVKNSGIGRELGEHGLKEFVNVKSVIIEN